VEEKEVVLLLFFFLFIFLSFSIINFKKDTLFLGKTAKKRCECSMQEVTR